MDLAAFWFDLVWFFDLPICQIQFLPKCRPLKVDILHSWPFVLVRIFLDFTINNLITMVTNWIGLFYHVTFLGNLIPSLLHLHKILCFYRDWKIIMLNKFFEFRMSRVWFLIQSNIYICIYIIHFFHSLFFYFLYSEKEEGWENYVENAVIEKCLSVGGDLFHIFVDKSSKEVRWIFILRYTLHYKIIITSSSSSSSIYFQKKNK